MKFFFSGLAAPAIAAGFSALAPTLGTIIPVIGASGFAAAASAAGTVAGSVAVAASFGGRIIHEQLEVITSYRVEIRVLILNKFLFIQMLIFCFSFSEFLLNNYGSDANYHFRGAWLLLCMLVLWCI